MPIVQLRSIFTFAAGTMNVRESLLSLTCIVISICTLGCNTLGSLGLPTGSTVNKLLKPTREIANEPGRSLLQPIEGANRPLATYIVEIGDSILIEPVSFDTTIRLPGDQIVKPDGTVSLGQFGHLQVVNKSIQQIQNEAQQQINTGLIQELESAFEMERIRRLRKRERDAAAASEAQPETEPADDPEREQRELLKRRIEDAVAKNKVSVRLVNWDSKKIYVLGEVNSPGAFLYNGHQNVLDGIIEAGGLTSRANHHEIVVARPTDCDSCRTVMKVCYDQIVQLGDTSTNYQLQPGDRVFVPALTFRDDLKQTLAGNRGQSCPRCAKAPVGCDLAVGCPAPTTGSPDTAHWQFAQPLDTVRPHDQPPVAVGETILNSTYVQ